MTPRRFTKALNLTLAAAFAAALIVPAVTHDAPVGGYVGIDHAIRDEAINEPEWGNTDHRADRDGCVPAPRTTGIASEVIVSDREGVTQRIGWNAAQQDRINAANANTDSSDNVWIVGTCR